MLVVRKFNREKHWIELYFDEDPTGWVLGQLRSNEWRFNEDKGCWYHKDFKGSREFSEDICETINGEKRQRFLNSLEGSSSHLSNSRSDSDEQLIESYYAQSSPAGRDNYHYSSDRANTSDETVVVTESKGILGKLGELSIPKLVIINLVIVGIVALAANHIYTVREERAQQTHQEKLKAQKEDYEEQRKEYLNSYKEDLKSYTSRDTDNHVYLDYVTRAYNRGTLKQQVTYHNTMTDYQHLGTNIVDYVTYNGKRIESGGVIKLSRNGKMTYTIEEEDSYPDSATINLLLNGWEKDDYLYGVYYKDKVTVYESGGRRYAGAYAKFRYKVDINPYVNKEKIKRYAERKLQNSGNWKQVNEEYHIFNEVD